MLFRKANFYNLFSSPLVGEDGGEGVEKYYLLSRTLFR
jgi:hypothetical protein